jgi:hypothetical protein
MMRKLLMLVAGLTLFVSVSYAAAPAQRVYFVEPKNGAVVTSPFKVVFGVSGMVVEPAGEIKPDSGHHHLLVNTGPVKEGEVIPADDTHLHFGKAQTETEVTLAPGKYALTMQFANGAHQSYGKKMSKTIHIVVK